MKNTCYFILLFLCLFGWVQFSTAQEFSDKPVVPVTPLRNPDRGFHLESNYFVHNYVNPFNKSEKYPGGFIDDRLKRFEAAGDSLTLTQLYLYLTEYVNVDIPSEAFDRMQVILDDLKAKGYKAIIRFAYNYTGLNTSGGETEEGIMRHLEQLRPFILKNYGQIAVCQMGFIGAWGEWHTSPLSNSQQTKNRLVNELLDIFPDGYCLQIRYPNQKKSLALKKESDWLRIGFANDYFTAGEHSHAPGNDFVPGDDAYIQATQEAPYFFMSGEIPYNENTEWGLHDLISVEKTLQILRDHHYSAFDITQNNELNIKYWKQYKVTPSLLDSLQILYDPAYFKDGKGEVVARSAYDFIRDHLGYRLNLLTASLQKEPGYFKYDIKFANTGFATIVNPRPVYLVFINERDQVVKEVKLDVNPKDWQPYDLSTKAYIPWVHALEGGFPLSLKGNYRVGIWMPDNHPDWRQNEVYDLKWVENEHLYHWRDAQQKYAVNIVGTIAF